MVEFKFLYPSSFVVESKLTADTFVGEERFRSCSSNLGFGAKS